LTTSRAWPTCWPARARRSEDTFTVEQQIADRLANGHSFAWVARRVTPEVAASVRELIKTKGLKGIYFQNEFQRFYPDDQIAAQVLGYVGADDNGLGGLELKYEPQLHGNSRRRLTAVDARRHVRGSSEQEPGPGLNLVLTIDEKHPVHGRARARRRDGQDACRQGTVVVQDVHNRPGAGARRPPTFNPNISRKTTPALLRDHAVSDIYEPGSVFKLVTYSAALEQRVVTPDDKIDCQGGAMSLPPHHSRRQRRPLRRDQRARGS